MAKVLVKFRKDWADEFDVYGFAVYEKEVWEKELKTFFNANGWSGFYFGTNEGYDPDDYTKEHFAEGYTICDITDEEAEVLERFFKRKFDKLTTYGIFPHPIELVDVGEEYWEEK